MGAQEKSALLEVARSIGSQWHASPWNSAFGEAQRKDRQRSEAFKKYRKRIEQQKRSPIGELVRNFSFKGKGGPFKGRGGEWPSCEGRVDEASSTAATDDGEGQLEGHEELGVDACGRPDRRHHQPPREHLLAHLGRSEEAERVDAALVLGAQVGRAPRPAAVRRDRAPV